VLLFAEKPSGLLGGKAAVRVFHYRGTHMSTDPNTNLAKQPITIDGPLIQLIRDASQTVARELGRSVQHGPLGFEIVQKYPVRVINEAITNAVIHRDYRLPSDVIIRIFSDRVEVESPGLLVGPVTINNIFRIGTHARNPLIVQNLREFPSPPNLDAGEGVPMMFGTMWEAGLYPPLYRSRPNINREAVLVVLLNRNRPTAWEQVSAYLDEHGSIANAEVRMLMETDDTLAASKQLRAWVDQGLLVVANPKAGKNVRRYSKPDADLNLDFFSDGPGKEGN
jgi:ATP-dependent DNA helicase RecG